MAEPDWPAVEIINAAGAAPVVLVCEHASAHIPVDLAELGLDPEGRLSHAAWDIGARDVARHLSARLDAPLIAGATSRLVYDCNRPPDAPDCIPAQSERIRIPGNAGLSAEGTARRAARIHDPYHQSLHDALDRAERATAAPIALITIHSFTPIYHGQPRAVEVGVLHDASPALAEAFLTRLKDTTTLNVAMNEPYAASDGVTYTLRKHGEARGLANVMIEIRNDLIDTDDRARVMAERLLPALNAALADITQGEARRA